MYNNWLRAVAREIISLKLTRCLTVFCAVFLASLISMPAAAQNAQAGPQNTQAAPSTPINIQDIVARPIPERTTGLDPGKIVKWSLKDAILAALEKNVDMQLEQENVRFTQYNLIAAQGFYDPMTTSRILYNKSINPNVARFTGAGGDTINNDSLTYNFGASKNFERWGSILQANFNNARQISNASNLSTGYSPGLVFQFTQPLFKGFQIDQTRRNIKVFKKQLALNDATFRAKVIQIILNVEQAYWDLSLARQNEEVQRKSLGLAETFLDNTKRQVEVGTLPQLDVISAATQLESNRQNVFSAMNNVGIAENTLKNLVAGGSDDPIWSSLIEPIEKFDSKQASIPVADAIKLAHENRPEIRQLDLQGEMNKIDIDLARNLAKPQIDFISSYATTGAAGTPNIVPGPNCGSPVDDPVNPGKKICVGLAPVLQGNAYVPGVQTVPFDPAVIPLPAIADQFIGGYGTALGNMFKNKFRTWSVGVQFSLPLRNRTAKANLGFALETKRQLDLQTRQLMQNIEVQVRNAVQAVETAKMRIDAAEAQTRYAQQQLDGEQKKFAAGLSTTFLALQRQNDLSVAQVSELQAKADYNKALATLYSVMATTLSNYSIDLPQDKPVTIK
ncbi:MAG: TolC family protein [Chloracidobacterium sp.]|nr:TolC family protein [Chloracidobacterium sp.]